mmetsp:Transcript_95003/g.268357  ORF Transcript_95003/g.268357 Transcript_95003/m.268357 type:complete len:387 (-) Transcript_95003:25-1185(-)
MPPVIALNSESSADGILPNHANRSCFSCLSANSSLRISIDAIMKTRPKMTRKVPSNMNNQNREDMLPTISLSITVSLANRLKSLTTLRTRKSRTVRRKDTSRLPPDVSVSSVSRASPPEAKRTKTAIWSCTCSATRRVSKAFQYFSLPLQKLTRSADMRKVSSMTKQMQKTKSKIWTGRGGMSSSRLSIAIWVWTIMKTVLLPIKTLEKIWKYLLSTAAFIQCASCSISEKVQLRKSMRSLPWKPSFFFSAADSALQDLAAFIVKVSPGNVLSLSTNAGKPVGFVAASASVAASAAVSIFCFSSLFLIDFTFLPFLMFFFFSSSWLDDSSELEEPSASSSILAPARGLSQSSTEGFDARCSVGVLGVKGALVSSMRLASNATCSNN